MYDIYSINANNQCYIFYTKQTTVVPTGKHDCSVLPILNMLKQPGIQLARSAKTFEIKHLGTTTDFQSAVKKVAELKLVTEGCVNIKGSIHDKTMRRNHNKSYYDSNKQKVSDIQKQKVNCPYCDRW